MSELKSPLWLIAVPTDNSATVTFDKLNTRTAAKNLSENFRFSIPTLKVGTLDTLMKLSDSVATGDSEAEQLVKKLQRTYIDLIDDENSFAKIDGEATGHDGSDGVAMAGSVLLVNDLNPREYVQEFKWDAARFPLQADLQILAQMITDLNDQYAEDLKKNWSRYSETKTTLVTLRRKNQGSLLLRPLSGLIDPDDCIEGEYLSSLMIVVPDQREQEFLNTYTTLASDMTIEEFIAADLASSSAEEDKRKSENAENDQKLLRSRAEKLLKTGVVIPGSAK
jgi:V-type H+-transporting ATPase subunit C